MGQRAGKFPHLVICLQGDFCTTGRRSLQHAVKSCILSFGLSLPDKQLPPQIFTNGLGDMDTGHVDQNETTNHRALLHSNALLETLQ